MAAPKSAKNAVVRFGGNTLFAAMWDVDDQHELAKTPNFEGEGYRNSVPCLRGARVEIEGWVAGEEAIMFDAPKSIGNDPAQSDVRLYTSGTDSPYWNFPYFNIESCKMTARVEDVFRYRIVGEADGAFSTPTGTIE